MSLSPIQPPIQPITIDTMLNNNGPNIGDRLNFVMCERSFRIYFYKITSQIRQIAVIV